jgi:hypothetical protein
MLTGSAVYGTVRTVVWEDGGGNPASYPIQSIGCIALLRLQEYLSGGRLQMIKGGLRLYHESLVMNRDRLCDNFRPIVFDNRGQLGRGNFDLVGADCLSVS